MVAAKLANMSVGGDRPSFKDGDSANLRNRNYVSQAEAAELLNVSKRTVTAAAKVKAKRNPRSGDRGLFF
jgi:hypothetical protein